MMNLSVDFKSSDDFSEGLCKRNNKILNNTPRSLEHQLHQLQQEKLVLLDQIAQFDVPVCFSCHNKIPMMEETLGDMKERRLKRLRKLRETCVRASNNYQAERERLLYLESELNNIYKKSEELKLIYDKEQQNIKVLNKEINDIKVEQEILTDIKLKSKNHLNDLKSSVKNIQDENYYLDTKEDKAYIEKECETMKRQLKELKVERNELETELYSIANYIKIKENELENFKKNLNGVRQEENILHESKNSAIKEQNKLQIKLEDIKKDIFHLKNEISEHETELEKSQNILQETKEAKEKTIKDQDKMRKELIDLAEGTKRLRNVLNDYRIQHKKCEDQIVQNTEKLNVSKLQLEELKVKFCETAKQVEYLENHYRESQNLQEALRLKLVEEFANSRAQLRMLREQNESVNQEIDRFISPILQEKKDTIDKEKVNLMQTNREIAGLRDTIRNKYETLTNLTTSFQILENEHKELKTKCDNEKLKINELTNVKNRDMKVVKELDQSCEVLNTICKRSTLFTHQIQEAMTKLQENFEESSDKLKNVEASAAKISTDGNKTLKEFIDFLQNYFMTFINEHCNELKETKEQDLELEIAEDTEKLKLLKEKRDYIEQEIHNAEKEVAKLHDDKINLAEKIELEISSTQKLKTSHVNARTDLENTQRILNEIQTRKKEVEAEINEETNLLDKLRKKRDETVEESCKLETKLKLQETKLNELYAEIKSFQEEKNKKMSILHQLGIEIQQLEFDIATQRKKHIQNINMHNQERHEFLMENKTQNEKVHSSLQNLAEKAREGVKNPYPRSVRSNEENNPSNATPGGRTSSKSNASKNSRPNLSSSSEESSSDENLQELVLLGKLRKK